MPHAVELARFTTTNEDELRITRSAAIDAVRGTFPGMLQALLTRLDDGSYLDIVVWEDRQSAEAAAQGVMSLPAFAAWAEHIGSVVSFEHAEVVVAL